MLSKTSSNNNSLLSIDNTLLFADRNGCRAVRFSRRTAKAKLASAGFVFLHKPALFCIEYSSNIGNEVQQ